jgi:hypothetical protein
LGEDKDVAVLWGKVKVVSSQSPSSQLTGTGHKGRDKEGKGKVRHCPGLASEAIGWIFVIKATAEQL